MGCCLDQVRTTSDLRLKVQKCKEPSPMQTIPVKNIQLKTKVGRDKLRQVQSMKLKLDQYYEKQSELITKEVDRSTSYIKTPTTRGNTSRSQQYIYKDLSSEEASCGTNHNLLIEKFRFCFNEHTGQAIGFQSVNDM